MIGNLAGWISSRSLVYICEERSSYMFLCSPLIIKAVVPFRTSRNITARVRMLFLALLLLIVPYVQCGFNSSISSVPLNCVNPEDKDLWVQESLRYPLPPCVLPFIHHGPNGQLGHGARLNETSPPFAYSKGTYNVSWAFYKSFAPEDLVGKIAPSLCSHREPGN